ncbi:hypothetical protein [Iodobacter ciconiae]|uniref:Uncharacterized protein n=1 Tax=Iodobacter ciconiae TaxID=2496266 RepID=A0A3S8ZPZ3_9NEIS|nr:hypothetical protein [Iodobacter ciconiae]AZN35527.1 hypothetical protein EJO50_02900 [Iodobacter ciconiae]
MLNNTVKPKTKPALPVSFGQDGFASHDGLVPCFCHDTHTLEYIGTAEMWVSKSCGLPAGAVLDAPEIRPAKNKAVIRDTANQRWVLIEDYRHMLACQTSDGAARLIDTLGPIPEGFTLQPYFEGAIWSGTKWLPGDQPLPVAQAESEPDPLAVLQDKIDRMETLLAQVLSEPVL